MWNPNVRVQRLPFRIPLMWKYQHFTCFWKIYGCAADSCTTATVALATVHPPVALHWRRCLTDAHLTQHFNKGSQNVCVCGPNLISLSQISPGVAGKTKLQRKEKANEQINQSCCILRHRDTAWEAAWDLHHPNVHIYVECRIDAES